MRAIEEAARLVSGLIQGIHIQVVRRATIAFAGEHELRESRRQDERLFVRKHADPARGRTPPRRQVA